jgi:HipA-like protein
MADRTLRIYLDGIPTGTVTQSSHGSLAFAYDDEYLDQTDPTPLSLSLPVLSDRHRDKAVRAYLEGLLPDSEGARQRWGREYNVSPNNPFSLLAHVGRDAAGAVQILPPDVDSADARARNQDIQWLSDADLAELAQDLATHQFDWDPGRFGGRWSLAGAQPKVALFRDPKSGQSIHPSLKYQSDGGPGVGDIADLLNRLPIEDRGVNAERFFKALAYNVLIGATDAHAKNYSLVLIGSRAQVSPLYDVASAAPYDQRERLRSSMKIGDHWKMLDVNTSDWSKVGRRLGIPTHQAVAWVAELRDELPGAFERAAASLPMNTRPEAERMAERIIEHVGGTWKPNLNR